MMSTLRCVLLSAAAGLLTVMGLGQQALSDDKPLPSQSPGNAKETPSGSSRRLIPLDRKIEPDGPPKRYAVCVGVNKYLPASGYADLNYAGADAIALAEALLESCEFDHVLLMTDADVDPLLQKRYGDRLKIVPSVTRDTIRDETAAFFAQSQNRGDLVVFFFAGHGDKLPSNAPFLVPGDYDPKGRPPKYLYLSHVLRDALGSDVTKAKHKLILFDACRVSADGKQDHPFPEGFRAALSEQGLSMCIMTACDEGQSAVETHALKHGVFSKTLIDSLEGKAFKPGRAEMSPSEIYAYIAETFKTEKWNPPQAPQRFFSGEEFALRVRDVPQALPAEKQKFLDDVLADYHEAKSHYVRGDLAKANHSYDKCITYMRVADLDETHSQLYGRLHAGHACVLHRLDKLDAARSAEETAKKHLPQEEPALYELKGYQFLARQDWENAALEFASALKLSTSENEAAPDLIKHYAVCLYKLKKFTPAAEQYFDACQRFVKLQKLVEADDCVENAAKCYEEANEPRKALEVLRWFKSRLMNWAMENKTESDAQKVTRAEVLLRVSECFANGEFLDDAEESIETSLALHKGVYGDEGQEVARTLLKLGEVALLKGQDDHNRAEPSIRNARIILAKTVGKSHPDYAAALIAEGKMLFRKGDIRDIPLAEMRFDIASEIFDAAYGPDHRNSSKVRQEMAEFQLRRRGPSMSAPAALASQIATILKDAQEESIAMGQFTVAPNLGDLTTGTGISYEIAQALEREGIRLDRTSTLSLTGGIYLERTDEGKLTVELAAMIRDGKKSGRQIARVDAPVSDTATIAMLLGATAELPANLDPAKRDALLEKQLETPQATVKSTKVAANQNSLYAVELLVIKDGKYQPLPPELQDGNAFAKLGRDEKFAVKLINDSPNDVAVKLSLDGLSMFAFSEVKTYSHVIVPAKGSMLVKGWHRNNMELDSFMKGGFPESAVAQVPKTTDGGTITAVFSAAWSDRENRPGDEPGGSVASTGFGPPTPTEASTTSKEWNVGVPRSVVSVRY
jgi:uncharacterized caspase-like protein